LVGPARGEALHVAGHRERAVVTDRAHAGRLGAQRVPLDQELAAQQAFQRLPHLLQLVAQHRDVVAGFLLRLAFRLGGDLQLVLATGRDLALEFELVDLLPLGSGLALVGHLLAVPRGDERAAERGPQRGDNAETQPLLLVGEHEQSGGRESEEHGACE
jgi:hypothetical protein